MTREQALTAVRRLALGLEANQAGVARLLERVSQHHAAETLRDALTELGAEALLDAEGRP